MTNFFENPNVICKNCIFWEEIRSGSRLGKCRLNPPTVLVTDGLRRTVFPAVDAFEWCGEFWRKTTKKGASEVHPDAQLSLGEGS